MLCSLFTYIASPTFDHMVQLAFIRHPGIISSFPFQGPISQRDLNLAKFLAKSGT